MLYTITIRREKDCSKHSYTQPFYPGCSVDVLGWSGFDVSLQPYPTSELLLLTKIWPLGL